MNSRFDVLNRESVRLRVSVPGFDLDRASKRLQRQQRHAAEASDGAQQGATTPGTPQEASTEPDHEETGLIVFGSGAPATTCETKTTTLDLEI